MHQYIVLGKCINYTEFPKRDESLPGEVQIRQCEDRGALGVTGHFEWCPCH